MHEGVGYMLGEWKEKDEWGEEREQYWNSRNESFFFFSNKSITQLFYIKLLLGKKIYRFFKDFFCLVKASLLR